MADGPAAASDARARLEAASEAEIQGLVDRLGRLTGEAVEVTLIVHTLGTGRMSIVAGADGGEPDTLSMLGNAIAHVAAFDGRGKVIDGETGEVLGVPGKPTTRH